MLDTLTVCIILISKIFLQFGLKSSLLANTFECGYFHHRYYLKCYVYLSQLEALNIPYNLERFLSSSKEGMIKGLWKNHSNEPQVEISPPQSK